MTVKLGPTLPPYPTSGGPVAAKQLQAAQERYRKQLADLDAELERAEQAFAAAFERSDETRAVRDRISGLATKGRRDRRRMT